MFLKRNIFSLIITIAALMGSGCSAEQDAPLEEAVAEGPSCSLESLRDLPDVRINEVTEEAAPVPHFFQPG